MDASALSPDDRAALASSKKLQTLRCDVTEMKPEIGMDLRFRTGYLVNVPLAALTGASQELKALVQVTPLDQPGRPALFATSIQTPPIDAKAGGSVELSGEYAVGPGKYQVDWLMRSRSGVCTDHWKIEAKLRGDLRQTPLPIAAGVAEELPPDPFHEDVAAVQRAGRPLYVRLLVNFSAGKPARGILTGDDIEVLASILRGIAREPRFSRFSVTAFSMDNQKVLYRQPAADRVDFDALGQVVKTMRPGTIDIQQITDRESGARFLTGLLVEEMSGQPAPDAVVVVSPKFNLDTKLPDEELAKRMHVECPVFYLNYNPDPVGNPWRGPLGSTLKGAFHSLEYTITRPNDLGDALKDMQARLDGNH